MAKEIIKKAPKKKTVKKVTNTKPKKETSNKASRQLQVESSNMILVGTAILVILVLGYISIEYFMV